MLKRRMSSSKPGGSRPKPKVTVAQLSILISAIESDPSLYNVAQSDMISFLNVEKWLKVTDKLNECWDGALLNTQSWKYVSLLDCSCFILLLASCSF